MVRREDTASFGHVPLQAICQRFQIPMENASVDCFVIQDEWDDIVDYARKYLNIVQQEDYKVIWWNLFNVVDAKQWSNTLPVIEQFCLPMSNGHLERVFSQLKLIKINRRICLGEDTLDLIYILIRLYVHTYVHHGSKVNW